MSIKLQQLQIYFYPGKQIDAAEEEGWGVGSGDEIA